MTIDNIRYQKLEGFCSAEIEGELVLLDIDSGKYFALSRTGRAIWEALDEPSSTAEVADRLQRRFAVPAERCCVETEAFLRLLADRGLVRAISG